MYIDILGRRASRATKRRRYEETSGEDDGDGEDAISEGIDEGSSGSERRKALKTGDLKSQEELMEASVNVDLSESEEKLGRGARTRAKVTKFNYCFSITAQQSS